MSHGSWCWQRSMIEQHWAEVKGWRKQWHVVNQAKSRRRHCRYCEGQLFVGFGLVHDLAAEKSVESGCFNGSLKVVIYQTSCFSKTIAINITPLSIHWLTWNWHPEQYFLQLETWWDLPQTTTKRRIINFRSKKKDFMEPLLYHFDLIWWIASAEECQSHQISFNHHKLTPPIVRIEMREWLFPFKCDQVSSQLLRCAGLSKMKRNQKIDLHHIFWFNHNEIKD